MKFLDLSQETRKILLRNEFFLGNIWWVAEFAIPLQPLSHKTGTIRQARGTEERVL